jgi:hypothetical protein
VRYHVVVTERPLDEGPREHVKFLTEARTEAQARAEGWRRVPERSRRVGRWFCEVTEAPE